MELKQSRNLLFGYKETYSIRMRDVFKQKIAMRWENWNPLKGRFPEACEKRLMLAKLMFRPVKHCLTGPLNNLDYVCNEQNLINQNVNSLLLYVHATSCFFFLFFPQCMH